MLVPISWLKDYVEISLTPEELSEKLVSCGFEIEEIIDLSKRVQNVYTAKLLDVKEHPNTNKLLLCKTDVADKGVLSIVTNDLSLKVNDIVPVALDNATLYDGKTVKKCFIKNVESDGMFCGLSELGCDENDFIGASYDSVLKLPEDTPIGCNINNILGRNDFVLDVSVTANRPDANSIIGIAREVAAITHQKMKKTILDEVQTKFHTLTLNNDAPDLCRRYMGALVKDVKVTESPAVIKNRLRSVGIRPINNIVDITNYVLIATGQPMHAFNADKVEANTIIVRRAAEGESIIALDGNKYALDSSMLTICDVNKPLAIAGVMGGMDSSITDATTTIILESANFARDNIRYTSRKLGLQSDSSSRFEKGIDLYSQELGMQLAIELIKKFNWGTFQEVTDSLKEIVIPKKITFTRQDIEKILGINLTDRQILSVLTGLEFNATKDANYDSFIVTIPRWREDIVGVNDIAEEIIRIIGFDNIGAVSYKEMSLLRGSKPKRQTTISKIKELLLGCGASEIITYSFINPNFSNLLKTPIDKHIKLLNPLSEDFSIMRTNLAFSMLKTMSSNYNHGNKKLRLFEVANVYIPKELPLQCLPKEELTLCISATGEDFYEFKSMIDMIFDVLRISIKIDKIDNLLYMHPYRLARISENNSGESIGYFGEVNSSVTGELNINSKMYIAELNLEKMLEMSSDFTTFKEISKYQASERDIAILVNENVVAADILNVIKELNQDNLVDYKIFDIYSGTRVKEGSKSVAINLKYQNSDKTLTEDEINADVAAVLDSLKIKLCASLR
ncbi:MAG TPA: phenylalanine--tRNA ligase subunit beta [Clostridia bacterium]|jgi:phenylalanyl-tRNA synthetase beta chain|nr:phenylalanine--tRNA ligase subunit beta [Clostridia bacterium]